MPAGLLQSNFRLGLSRRIGSRRLITYFQACNSGSAAGFTPEEAVVTNIGSLLMRRPKNPIQHWLALILALATLLLSQKIRAADVEPLCLDGFCIGQPITDTRFENTAWVVPRKDFAQEPCKGVGCEPEVAFRGYPPAEQVELATAVSWVFHDMSDALPYNVITMQNLATLRDYHYECNASARGMWGERRFIGAYKSIRSGYLTVIGLRLIGGKLRVYRIARQYPYRNPAELRRLAQELWPEYGNRVLFVDYLSSNAPYEVMRQGKDGWFGRSTMFNSSDMADNAAELVLIDSRTRSLLQPTSMPSSGDIKPLPMRIPEQCVRSLPLQ
jgi:hypothetical protein